MTERTFDVVVAGAGPAGMAAAIAASSHGRSVAVLDDNGAAGGQIWRRGLSDEAEGTDRLRRRISRQFQNCGAVLLPGRRIVAAHAPAALDAWQDGTEEVERFHYSSLVIATGARERFLPFPGWTLPGVYGAGGLQALVRGGMDVRDRRVVVAGTGPLLLAVAAHLLQDGAKVLGIYEQAPVGKLLPFAARLWRRPAKLMQTAHLMAQLRSVPYRRGWWPAAARGSSQLESVELTDGRKRTAVACDALACGFHLLPNTELAALLGCGVRGGRVLADSLQRTSQPQVFCAGEVAGVAGVDAAVLEGEIAGHAAAGALDVAERLTARAAKERRFAAAMERAFALRPELLQLADGQTILCRCEDVRLRDLAAMAWQQDTWTDAKLQTRCGMGPCQGRICGPILETLFGARNESIRPPLFPIPMAALACDPAAAESIHTTAPQETA